MHASRYLQVVPSWLDPEALRRREALALGRFFDVVQPRVRQLVWRLLGASSELDDVVQSSLLAVLVSLPSIRGTDEATVFGFVRQVTVHTTRMHLRKKRALRWLRLSADELEAPEPALLPPDPGAARAMTSLYRVLERLPTDERVSWALRHLEQYELTEVAAACDVSLSTVKRRLASANERLARLAGSEPELAVWLRGGPHGSAA